MRQIALGRLETPTRCGGRLRALAVAVLAAAIGLSAAAPEAAARPAPPNQTDRAIAILVTKRMQRQHLSKKPINDEISKRTLNAFLERLDPLKLYFYQSDVDQFAKYDEQLDDLFRSGRVDFAHVVFDRFLARVNERVDTALGYVDGPHDFTVDEEMIADADAASYPKTPEEAAERWRKRVKFDLMLKVAESDPDATSLLGRMGVEKNPSPIIPPADERAITLEEQSVPSSVPEDLVDDVVDSITLPGGVKLTKEGVIEEAREKLRKRYRSLLKRWDQTSSNELLEMYVSSLTSGFDPHSSYLSPETLDNFEISMRLELDGIGASLRSEDGYTEVAEVIAGGAADEHGELTKGDLIVGVGQGSDGPLEDIVDMKLNDVVKLIRGKRGTIVRLQVKPVDNPNDLVEYVITRDRIELKNQEARSAVIETGLKPNGQPYRVGVIDLPSFYMDMDGARAGKPDYKSATRDVRRLLDGFDEEAAAGRPIDAVVVDLRFNGGGSLTEAVNLTGLFIDSGPVVQVKGTDGRTLPYADEVPGMQWDGPLVVLTNRFSASASEIFAGAIQDYGRGIVVGDQSTHGKGTVQQLFDPGRQLFGNKNLGAIKITIQQFYRPGGDSTQNRGVLSDVTLPNLTDHLKGVTEAEMDYALPFDRVDKREHDWHGMAGPDIAAQLQRMSEARIAESDDFAEDQKRIDRYEAQKDRPTVSLNLAEFLTEREKLDTDKEKEEIGEQMSDSDRPVFDTDDHYNQETLEITKDYIKLLRENKLAIAR